MKRVTHYLCVVRCQLRTQRGWASAAWFGHVGGVALRAASSRLCCLLYLPPPSRSQLEISCELSGMSGVGTLQGQRGRGMGRMMTLRTCVHHHHPRRWWQARDPPPSRGPPSMLDRDEAGVRRRKSKKGKIKCLLLRGGGGRKNTKPPREEREPRSRPTGEREEDRAHPCEVLLVNFVLLRSFGAVCPGVSTSPQL